MTTRRRFLRLGLSAMVVLFLTTTLAEAKNTLWKIKSGDHLLYLQGSVHCLKVENYPLDAAIENAFSKSQVLVLEVDMKEMHSPQAAQLMLSKAMLPGEETLDKVLDAETYALAGTKCAEAGLPIAMLNKFKPWFFSMTLAMTKMQALGFDPKHGLDTYFYNKAEADQKKVIGLETVEFQINLFDLLAGSDQKDLVKQTIKDLDILEQEMTAIVKAWAEGDTEQIEQTMLKSFKEYPQLYKKFITDRNVDWSKRIDSLLKQPETHMMVVGAAHLPGKQGLLALLKQKGYSIEQL